MQIALLVALAGASCVVASAATEAPAIAEFDQAFAGISDYACILHVHEATGTQSQDRIYQYSFMKQHYVKTLILDGNGKGSGGVWVGGCRALSTIMGPSRESSRRSTVVNSEA